MIQEAAAAGSTHVKIQSIFSKEVTNRKEFERLESNSTYFSRPYINEVNRLRSLELSLDDHKFFIDYAFVDYNILKHTNQIAIGLEF